MIPTPFSQGDVIRKAREEVAKEKFREAVDKEKEKLRRKRPLLDRLIPFRIVILKKETE